MASPSLNWCWSLGIPFLQQSYMHIKAAFSIWDIKAFCKKCKFFTPAGIAATSFTNFLFFTVVLMLDSFILKWRATAVYGISSTSTFLVMLWLCFLGALPASLVLLVWVPRCYSSLMVLLYTWWKMLENCTRSLFTAICNLPERWTAHMEVMSLTRVLNRYSQHLSSARWQQELVLKCRRDFS